MQAERTPQAPSSLSGKVALVTGGGRGLGRSLAFALAEAGADVAFSYCNSTVEDVDATTTGVRARGRRVHAQRADARAPGALVAFVDAAVCALGGLDVLINNAGVFRHVKPLEIGDDVLSEAFDVNVRSAVMASTAAAAHMRRRGGGSIVNVASLGGLMPYRNYLPYCATKAALVMATRCLALGLAPEVRVNAVAPGLLDTPEPPSRLSDRVPLARFGTYAEVVECVMYLVQASYTTGEVVRVDGGRWLN